MGKIGNKDVGPTKLLDIKSFVDRAIKLLGRLVGKDVGKPDLLAQQSFVDTGTGREQS